MSYTLPPHIAEGLKAYAKKIETVVVDGHAGRSTWDKRIGQWLVYGHERALGFAGAVELEAAVETAFREGRSVGDAAALCLAKLAVERAKGAT